MLHKKEMLIIAVGAGAIIYLAMKAKKQAAAVAEAVNPTSDQNIFYKGVNAVGAAITGAETGREDFSLGSWIYDLTHNENY